MKMIWVITRRQMLIAAAALLIAAAAWIVLSREPWAIPAGAGAAGTGERVIHLVTGEFKTSTADGRTLEVYRWDPGFIYVNRGETVQLRITGINGQSHPFEIEGLNIRGEVKKGEETVVTFKADKEGIFRLICHVHSDQASNGPMIGYIVVD
jgi:plastocyanin